MTKLERFLAIEQQPELLNKLKRAHQQHYIRKRLEAIELLWNGRSRPEVCKLVRCSYQSLDTWLTLLVDVGLEAGLKTLASPTTRTLTWRLSSERQTEFREIVLHQTPQDYGMDELVWTGKTLCRFLKEYWGVEYHTSRIYEILSALGLSHQKAHRDYLEANPSKQRAYAKRLKKSTYSATGWREDHLF
jgi:transposase